jgi:hypothetical protein
MMPAAANRDSSMSMANLNSAASDFVDPFSDKWQPSGGNKSMSNSMSKATVAMLNRHRRTPSDAVEGARRLLRSQTEATLDRYLKRRDGSAAGLSQLSAMERCEYVLCRYVLDRRRAARVGKLLLDSGMIVAVDGVGCHGAGDDASASSSLAERREYSIRAIDYFANVPKSKLERLAKIMADPITGVPYFTRRRDSLQCRQCFVGVEAVDWLVVNVASMRGSREAARHMLHRLIECTRVYVVPPTPTDRVLDSYGALYAFTVMLPASGRALTNDDMHRLAKVMQRPRDGVRIEDRRSMFSTHLQSFTAGDAVEWLAKHLWVPTADARLVGAQLVRSGAVLPLSASSASFAQRDALFRFRARARCSGFVLHRNLARSRQFARVYATLPHKKRVEHFGRLLLFADHRHVEPAETVDMTHAAITHLRGSADALAHHSVLSASSLAKRPSLANTIMSLMRADDAGSAPLRIVTPHIASLVNVDLVSSSSSSESSESNGEHSSSLSSSSSSSPSLSSSSLSPLSGAIVENGATRSAAEHRSRGDFSMFAKFDIVIVVENAVHTIRTRSLSEFHRWHDALASATRAANVENVIVDEADLLIAETEEQIHAKLVSEQHEQQQSQGRPRARSFVSLAESALEIVEHKD